MKEYENQMVKIYVCPECGFKFWPTEEFDKQCTYCDVRCQLRFVDDSGTVVSKEDIDNA